MTKEKVTLPRGYASWSQVNLWRSSSTHKAYIDRYIYGIPMYESKELIFGRFISQCLNGNLFALSPQQLNILSPIIDDREREEEVHLKRETDNGRHYMIKGFVDGGVKDGVFHEYKTGKTHPVNGDAWSQKKADSHGQLFLYAWYYFSKTGKIPSAELHWFETVELPNGAIELSGRHEVFPVKFTKGGLNKFMKAFDKTVFEIEDYFVRHNNLSKAWTEVK